MASIGDTVLIRAKAHYDAQGYCVVDGVFSPGEIDAIDTFFEDFKTRGHQAFARGVHYDQVDSSKELLRALHPHRFDERVLAWFLHPSLARVLKYYGQRGEKARAPVPVRMRRGQTLFFGGRLIHGSGPNRTDVQGNTPTDPASGTRCPNPEPGLLSI